MADFNAIVKATAEHIKDEKAKNELLTLFASMYEIFNRDNEFTNTVGSLICNEAVSPDMRLQMVKAIIAKRNEKNKGTVL